MLDIFNRNVIGGVAGLTADANSLVNYARTAAQRHLLTYNEDIPVELLAQRLCDMKQGYTQFGGNELFTVIKPTIVQFKHNLQVCDRSVYLSFTLAMTLTINFSCTTPIHQVIIPVGRRHVLVPTIAPHKAY